MGAEDKIASAMIFAVEELEDDGPTLLDSRLSMANPSNGHPSLGSLRTSGAIVEPGFAGAKARLFCWPYRRG
jgi:hypothetical protein